MTATCSSETSVDFQRTTWRYTPKDGNVEFTGIIYVVNLNHFRWMPGRKLLACASEDKLDLSPWLIINPLQGQINNNMDQTIRCSDLWPCMSEVVST
jgi:hypothetical protein